MAPSATVCDRSEQKWSRRFSEQSLLPKLNRVTINGPLYPGSTFERVFEISLLEQTHLRDNIPKQLTRQKIATLKLGCGGRLKALASASLARAHLCITEAREVLTDAIRSTRQSLDRKRSNS